MLASADQAWFKITISGGPKFDVYSIAGTEAVSDLYSYEVGLVSKNPSAPLSELVGKDVCLTIMDREKAERVVHGVIREMNQLKPGNKLYHYSCIIVPRLWFLTQTGDHRIYQDKTVVDIIKQLLEEQGFAGDAFSFDKCTPPPPREYCVQYRESDYYFISRLCEEEGIYFYFEHSKSQHKICFADVEGSSLPMVQGKPLFRYEKGSGTVAKTAVITSLNIHNKASSTKASYREWNFSQAKLNLEVKQEELDPKQAPPLPINDPETYQYPHLYQEQGEGERYVKLQTKRQIATNRWINAASDSSRFVPGFQFTIWAHPRQEVNAAWVVTNLSINAEQPGVLGDEAPDRGYYYSAHLSAIPAPVKYVPPLVHPKNRIVGQQAAIVVGEGEEEIYPDEHGRVKVQFFWDREGQWDEKSSCWIRVAQGWAGGQYGTMAIPRVGHEVLVSFLEGDPDRPIITGRVYHQLNKPPYGLPDNKTRSVFKSYSSPSSEKKGFNELRVEDKANQEEIYVRAEKDVNVFVKNEWSDQIGSNAHHLTGGSTFTRTVGETHRILEKSRVSQLGIDDYTGITNDRVLTVGNRNVSHSEKGTIISSADHIVLNSPKGISLICGESVITLLPSNLHVDGKDLWLNCANQEPVVVDTEGMKAPELGFPKGADFGSQPDGGDMAKPMPPKQPPSGGSESGGDSGAGSAGAGSAGAGAAGGGCWGGGASGMDKGLMQGSGFVAGDIITLPSVPTIPAFSFADPMAQAAGMASAITDTAAGTVAGIAGGAAGAVSGIVGATAGITGAGALAGSIGGFAGPLGGTVPDLSGAISDMASNLSGAAPELVQAATQIASGMANGTLNTTDALHAVSGVAGNLAGAVPSIAGMTISANPADALGSITGIAGPVNTGVVPAPSGSAAPSNGTPSLVNHIVKPGK